MIGKKALALGALLVMAASLTLSGFSLAIAGEQTAGSYKGIPYVSGGIGFDERQEMLALRSGYNLILLFAASDSSYCSDIEVVITSANGEQVFEAVSGGPWFFVNLPAGHYLVKVTPAGRGIAQQKDVTLERGRRSELHFFWKVSQLPR